MGKPKITQQIARNVLIPAHSISKMQQNTPHVRGEDLASVKRSRSTLINEIDFPSGVVKPELRVIIYGTILFLYCR
jgi:hypothetical protein